ncbi:MAG: phage holin family protein, partial [Oscillospiraceae bacterium]|nr:phage holin family protein [Oscillospiraceae bacterium]
TKIGSKRWEQLTEIAFIAVYAAEQMANAGLLEMGISKLDYATLRVKEALAKLGITFDDALIRAAIEAIVLDLKKGK